MQSASVPHPAAPEEKAEFTPFEEICQAALERSEPRLQFALEKAHIDVRDARFAHSPVAWLASQKDFQTYQKAVQFLIDHGASLEGAIYGHAQNVSDAEHLKMAFHFLDLAIDKSPRKSLKFFRLLANGFAKGGFELNVNDVLKIIDEEAGARDSLSLQSVAYHYVIGGHYAALDRLLLKVELLSEEYLDLTLQGAALGYAVSAPLDLVASFKQRVADKYAKHLPNVRFNLLRGYTQGRRGQEPIRMCAEIVTTHPDSADNALKAIAVSIAESGYLEDAELFLGVIDVKRHAQLQDMIILLFNCYVSNGHFAIAKALLQKIETKFPEEFPHAMPALAAAFACNGNMPQLLWVLGFIKDRESFQVLDTALEVVVRNFGKDGQWGNAHALLKTVAADPVYKKHLKVTVLHAVYEFAARNDSQALDKIMKFVDRHLALHRSAILVSRAEGYASGGHKRQAYAVLSVLEKANSPELHNAVTKVAKREHERGDCMDYEFVLKMLAVFQSPHARSNFLSGFHCWIERYDGEKLLARAKAYSDRMGRFHLNFESVSALNSWEARFLLFHSANVKKQVGTSLSLFQRLPEVHLQQITDYLIPSPIKKPTDFNNLWVFFAKRIHSTASLTKTIEKSTERRGVKTRRKNGGGSA